jgi:hypothetical protein
MIRRFFLLVLVLSLAAVQLWAQSKHSIKLLAKAKDKSILLRWAPTDATAWSYGNQYGYIIERYTVLRGKELLAKPERVILSKGPIKPLPLEKWRADAETNDYSAIAAEAIFSSSFEVNAPVKKTTAVDVVNKVKELEQRFSFALLAADHSFTTARLSGIAFKDSTVRADEKYLYRVFLSANTRIKTDTGLFYISVKDTSSLMPIRDVKAKFGDRTVTLRWPRSFIENGYSSFIIERSDDNGGTYKRLSSLPFLSLSNDVKEKDFQAGDSLPANGVKYYFRLRGTSPFGEIGPPSESVSGMGLKTLRAKASILEARETKQSQIMLRWKVTGDVDLIKGFHVEKASKENGDYKSVNKELIPSSEMTFTDPSPFSTNYYRIRVVGEQDQAAVSLPYLVQMADSIPPAAPKGLKVLIDTAGVVKLSWVANEEKDLFGYRVYRSNFQKSEFSQITNTPVTGTDFVDTITLKTLTRNIYYKLVAIDKRFNPSVYSEVVKAERPDILPPNPPVINAVKSTAKGAEITWIKSDSEDILNYTLYKKHRFATGWDVVHVFSTTDSTYYLDVIDDARHEYLYAFMAIDKSGNKSGFSHGVWAKAIDSGVKPAITKITFEVDRTVKVIKLKWDYNQNGVTKYAVYRAKGDGSLSLYKSMTGKSAGFEDRQLTMNTSYKYRVKALFADGSESEFSDEVKVVY